MIIGVDGNEANVNEHVGVSVYTLALLNYFQSVASEKVSFCIFLRQKPLASMPKENPHFLGHKFFYLFIFTQNLKSTCILHRRIIFPAFVRFPLLSRFMICRFFTIHRNLEKKICFNSKIGLRAP